MDMPNNPNAIQDAVNQGASAPGYTAGGQPPAAVMSAYNTYVAQNTGTPLTGAQLQAVMGGRL